MKCPINQGSWIQDLEEFKRREEGRHGTGLLQACHTARPAVSSKDAFLNLDRKKPLSNSLCNHIESDDPDAR